MHITKSSNMVALIKGQQRNGTRELPSAPHRCILEWAEVYVRFAKIRLKPCSFAPGLAVAQIPHKEFAKSL